MSIPKEPDRAKLVISVFMRDQSCFEKLFSKFEDAFGPVDIVSRWLYFDYTDYYYKEMGFPLLRKMLAFKELIAQGDLPGIKEKTNFFENLFLNDGKRTVNIDPGYLLLSRFVLATGKDYSHRIYIGRNIYADLTLVYDKKKGFRALDWTYPDYTSKSITDFLERVRNKYIFDLKGIKNND